MTNGANNSWLRRVLGVTENEPGVRPESESTEQTRRDLEELLDPAARRVEESDTAQACVDALGKKLAECHAEVELLREARAAAEARLGVVEAESQELRRELQRATESQVDAQRKAEVRRGELEKLRKSLKVVEQQRSDLDGRCMRITDDAEAQARENKALREKVELAERIVSALKAELERARKRPDQAVTVDHMLDSARKDLEKARAEVSALEPLRRANEGLERALAAAHADVTRCREVIAGLQRSSEDQLSRLADLELELRRRDETARRGELRLQGAGDELVRMVSLCAHALDVGFGGEAHLPLEIALADRGRAQGGTFEKKEHGAAASWLRGHLAELGLASSCQFDVHDDELIGRMSLSPALQASDPMVVARWIAAYATECLNRETHADRRLEQLEGAPGGIVWKASSRRLERKISPPPG
jgi:hypothetical protein